jgi:hypothetical protein
MLSDDALGRFALAIAPVAGVLFAAMITVLVFMVGRLADNTREAAKRARDAAIAVNRVHIYQVDLVQRYFDGEIPDEFACLITSLTSLRPGGEVPDIGKYWWQTERARQIARRRSVEVEEVGFDPQLGRLHRRLTPLIDDLSAAIVFNENSVLWLKLALDAVKVGVGVSAILFVGSLATVLATEIQIREIVPEGANPYIALFLMAGVIATVGSFVPVVLKMGPLRSEQSIDEMGWN